MRIDEVLQRIQGEFVEMPGLRVTAAQAHACGVSSAMSAMRCSGTRRREVSGKTHDGAFIRMDGARPAS